MTKLPNLAGFEGLLDLDRRGVDIRPTLLRVLTDQYLQSPTHTAEDERHYTELALRLIDETDVATRATVAARLAPHAFAPHPILLRLARDVLEVAEPVLRYSPRLSAADLDGIIAERGANHGEVIAQRLEVAPVRSSNVDSNVLSAVAALAARPCQHSESEIEAKAAENACNVGDKAFELCELFFAAEAAERQLILMSLDYLAEPSEQASAAMQRTEIWQLESAALQHKTEAVVQHLQRALGVSREQARRMVKDDLGEPIVVAAKAMELPADVLQRMLLFMNPRIGQSVERVYELAALFDQISLDAARRLIAIFRQADPGDTPAARHAAISQDATAGARQALSEAARRAPASRQSVADSRERAMGTNRR